MITRRTALQIVMSAFLPQRTSGITFTQSQDPKPYAITFTGISRFDVTIAGETVSFTPQELLAGLKEK